MPTKDLKISLCKITYRWKKNVLKPNGIDPSMNTKDALSKSAQASVHTRNRL